LNFGVRRVALLLALVFAVPAAATPPRDGPSNLQTLIWRAKPIYCGGAGKKLVSLTFDDGPGPYTDGIVAALRAGHARATFFDVGNRLAYWPDAARETATVGSLGVHTWTHAHLPRLKPARVRRELLQTQLAIFHTTQQLASVFRPPYEQATVRDDRIAESLNLLDVRWNVDSQDSRHGATPASTVAAVGASVGPGSIVLLHDTQPWTGEAVRTKQHVLRARQMRPVTLPDLIERDPPTGRCE
jgi:peptidoglycan/xylan/chitin deacetylase (PgdA/CDA1 family)